MNRDKIDKYFLDHENDLKRFEQDFFDLAICKVDSGDFEKAKMYFTDSLPYIFGKKPYWRASGQVNWLVDVVILSGNKDFYSQVWEELNKFKIHGSEYSHAGGDSPMANYCYGVMEMFLPGSGDLTTAIHTLLKYPRYKDFYACGIALKSILNQDQNGFSQSLSLLLKTHEGMAKHGGLRLSPEGWLCLPAMSLSILAHEKNLKVDIENEYLSLGYLECLAD